MHCMTYCTSHHQLRFQTLCEEECRFATRPILIFVLNMSPRYTPMRTSLSEEALQLMAVPGNLGTGRRGLS
jgi:hypothetical protein